MPGDSADDLLQCAECAMKLTAGTIDDEHARTRDAVEGLEIQRTVEKYGVEPHRPQPCEAGAGAVLNLGMRAVHTDRKEWLSIDEERFIGPHGHAGGHVFFTQTFVPRYRRDLHGRGLAKPQRAQGGCEPRTNGRFHSREHGQRDFSSRERLSRAGVNPG